MSRKVSQMKYFPEEVLKEYVGPAKQEEISGLEEYKGEEIGSAYQQARKRSGLSLEQFDSKLIDYLMRRLPKEFFINVLNHVSPINPKIGI